MDDSSFFDAVYEEVRRRAVTALVEQGRIQASDADSWQPILPACGCLAVMCDCAEYSYIHCSKCKMQGVFRDGSPAD